jgi:hypothetical protein
MYSKIILLNTRGYQLNIFLVVIGSISYLILIQQDHLGVYYKYLLIGFTTGKFMTDKWKSICAFTYCIFIIVFLSMKALSHHEPACSGTFPGGGCAQGCD